MKEFFDSVRQHFGPLNTEQVNGLEAIATASIGHPVKHIAYMMATAWHETGRFRYTHEIWGPTQQQAKYEPPSAKAKELGNTMKGDGKRFAGRGFVQLTGRANYVKASAKTGIDLVINPDLVTQYPVAAKVLVSGMTEGWFTEKKLSDFIEYEAMRKVVNGTDKAAMIGTYAVAFERALGAVPPVPAPVAPQDTKTAPPLTPQAPRGLFKALLDLILAIFKRKA